MAKYKIEIEIKHTLSAGWINDDEIEFMVKSGFSNDNIIGAIRETIGEDVIALYDEIMPKMHITVWPIRDGKLKGKK